MYYVLLFNVNKFSDQSRLVNCEKKKKKIKKLRNQAQGRTK
jgi:hypothetical protein